MNALALASLVVGLLVFRQPLLVILLAAISFAHLVWGQGRLDYVIEDMWVSLDKEIILSIPMFLLCGGVMTRGSAAGRLVRIAEAMTRHIPGGMAAACVLACAVFAAISGSSIVTMLAVGSVLYPAMRKAGYPNKAALGVVMAGGSLGVVLPPSIPLIIYGLVTETSIVDLFVAGLLPGLLMVILFVAYVVWTNRRLPTTKFEMRELSAALKSGIFALLMPILLLGGIYTGYFSATESAAIALVYAVIVEILIHKEMKLADMRHVVIDVAKLTGALFPLLAVALSLSLLLTEHRVPESMVHFVQGWFTGPIGFMVAVNILLLVVSCLMTTTEALLILGPLLAPVAVAYGYPKVFFGIVMIHNLEIGFMVPPLGLNLLVAMTAFKQNMSDLTRAVVPYVVLMVIGLAIIVAFPQLTMLLVKH